MSKAKTAAKRTAAATPSSTSTSSSSGSSHNNSTASSASSLFFLYASLAGVCGALSSVVGKLAVAAEGVPAMASAALTVVGMANQTETLERLLPLILRIVFFVSNAILTAQMWRFYLLALSRGPTPVCQIVNTGTNFAVSALVGLLVFGEEVNAMWGCGALLVVLGLALVVSAESSEKTSSDKKKQ